MKKFILLFVMLLVALPVFSESELEIIPIYTILGSQSGHALDSSSADTSYFKYPNPVLDSIIIYFENSATTGNPEVSGDLEITVDNVGDNFGRNVDATKISTSKWVKVGDVFTDVTTETTVLYYGISDSIAMSNPGNWARIVLSTDGDHDPAGIINRLGVILVPKTR